MSIRVINNVSILTFSDDITITNNESFREEMNKLVESQSSKLILNLSDISYLNSAALGVIANSVVTSRKYNKELVLTNINETVLEVFAIVKFKSFIKFFNTEELALDYFSLDINNV